eukprot:5771078-Alexandrium_andersonii.AAC.1
MDADGPLQAEGGAWRWIRVRGPAGEPGIRRMRVVPLDKEFAEAPAAVAFAAPAGPAAKQRLTTLRVTIWRDYLSADDWATAK